MSLDVHRRAELLMGQADRLAVEGRGDEASDLYRAAAAAEFQAFELIPLDRVRTRGIIAISSVALYRKGRAIDQAIRQAHLFLAREDLPEFARLDLEDLLDELRSERLANESGQTLGQDTYEWVLKGPGIGPGLARLTTVARTIEQVNKYGLRVFEYVAGAPIRVSGPAAPEIRQTFDMVMNQPTTGSFKFQVRFSTPIRQLPLFDEAEPVSAERVTATFGEILEAAVTPSSQGLEQLVSDPRYRDAFLRVVRSLAPDGKELSTVEVTGSGGVAFRSAILTPRLAREITEQLAGNRPSTQRETARHDTLRGVNLNEGWILLGQRGQEQKCYVRPDVVLADVVEGLIDRPVKVAGHFERRRFVVDDLEGIGELDQVGDGIQIV